MRFRMNRGQMRDGRSHAACLGSFQRHLRRNGPDNREVESVPWSSGYDLAEVVLACRSKHKSTILFDCAKFGVYNWECRPTRAFAPSLNWSPNKNSLRAMFPPSSARLNSACGRNGWRESTTSSA